MRFFKFLLSLIITVAFIYFLANPVTLQGEKERSLPPMGILLSPFSGCWQNAEPLTMASDESLVVPERKGKIKVLFDQRMVPHIFAENIEDALFAQGYVEARLRLWQMDMITRLAHGRLAEVLGQRMLGLDMEQRRKGLPYGAQKAVESWRKSEQSFRLIQAYTDGVNAWIDRLAPKDLPIEYKLLHFRPERWSPFKTALIKKHMDYTLCFREEDVESTNALTLLGKELFSKIYPEYNPKQSPVIPAGTDWDFAPVEPGEKEIPGEALSSAFPHALEKNREFVGSNNWAISKIKSASGHPILCNDPHLQLSLPSIWFELQLHTPAGNSYGVSVPGLPGIIIGFNENIAWGVTNVGHDLADYYEIDWTDAEKTSYQYDGAVKKVNTIVETFRIKDQEGSVTDTVKWTVWGPIVYEQDGHSKKDLALRWIAHDSPNSGDILTFQGLNTAVNYEDYRKALQHYNYPAQNFAFASRSGDIAITVNGDFPIKRDQQGRFIQDGSSSANAWQGFIPKQQVPAIKNPERGFVSSANQRSTDPTYPYYYNSPGFDDYRGRYLNAVLRKDNLFTVNDMMRLQNSNFSLQAAEALPVMIALTDTLRLPEREQGIIRQLKKWNYFFEGDLVEPVIFTEWFSEIYQQTFDEILVWKDSLPVLRPESWRLVDLLSRVPQDSLFDVQATPDRETAGTIVTKAFLKVCENLTDELMNPEYNWSGYKHTSIMHLTGIPSFSIMKLDIGGNRQALNAVSETHGPSWRMVVELGETVKGWGVFPGGQSGNPGSRYYDSEIEKWRKGEYNELLFMRSPDDHAGKKLFTLTINE